MPGMNDVIKSCSSQDWGRHGRRWNAYNELKQSWSQIVELHARRTGQRSLVGSYFTFMFAELNRRRDPDNVVGGAHKIVFDSLVGAGFIPNDGWKHVQGFSDYWLVDPERPGVLVIVTKAETLSREDAYAEFHRQKADEP